MQIFSCPNPPAPSPAYTAFERALREDGVAGFYFGDEMKCVYVRHWPGAHYWVYSSTDKELAGALLR